MADDLDRASALEEETRADALRAWRESQGPALSVQASRDTCRDCGDEIPPARRVAVPGCTLCVDCQTDAEREGR